jgi:hypothetical protein
MAISLDLQGIPEVIGRLQRLNAPAIQAGATSLEHQGNRIMLESQRLVPVLTGRLLLTSHVSPPVVEGSLITVELSYGRDGPLGPAPYAARQHFDASLNHPHGGQAFYLQVPLFQATASFTENIATDIRASLRRTS